MSTNGVPYTLERLLGGGAYAEVYAARAGDAARTRVAVKVARSAPRDVEGVTNAVFFARGRVFLTGNVGLWNPEPNDVLTAEADVLRRVRHPAFVKLLGEGRKPDGPGERAYLVLEYIEGASWRESIHTGRIPLARVVELVDCLDATSRAGLSHHGDIKPDNLMLEPSGRVRVLDPTSGMSEDESGPDGVRRLLCTDVYNPARLASDVPAIGILLVEVLTGHNPLLLATWDRPNRPIGEGLAEWLHGAAVVGGSDMLGRLPKMPLLRELRPDAPPELEAIALRCLGLSIRGGALDTTEPFASMADLARALRPFA